MEFWLRGCGWAVGSTVRHGSWEMGFITRPNCIFHSTVVVRWRPIPI